MNILSLLIFKLMWNDLVLFLFLLRTSWAWLVNIKQPDKKALYLLSLLFSLQKSVKTLCEVVCAVDCTRTLFHFHILSTPSVEATWGQDFLCSIHTKITVFSSRKVFYPAAQTFWLEFSFPILNNCRSTDLTIAKSAEKCTSSGYLRVCNNIANNCCQDLKHNRADGCE